MVERSLPSRNALVASVAALGLVVAVLGGMAFAQQDKYTVEVPGGLAFSEFRGYEGWQVVATSQNDKLIAAILANPVMIDARTSTSRIRRCPARCMTSTSW